LDHYTLTFFAAAKSNACLKDLTDKVFEKNASHYPQFYPRLYLQKNSSTGLFENPPVPLAAGPDLHRTGDAGGTVADLPPRFSKAASLRASAGFSARDPLRIR